MGRIRLRNLSVDPRRVRTGDTQVKISFFAMHEDEEFEAKLILKVKLEHPNLYVLDSGAARKEKEINVTVPKGSLEEFIENVTIRIQNPPIKAGQVGVKLISDCGDAVPSRISATLTIIA